ncbi:hypothetical protein DL93DRAFT_2076203 [Clavulina sp. PMI_390]|nr:hypothetical protein DL93DRAFT_2076203 [Clavulina sp. PMI_390]
MTELDKVSILILSHSMRIYPLSYACVIDDKKANPWIYHPPMSPAISSLPGTARNSMVSNASSNATETDPFHDIHRYNPQVSYPSTTLRHDQGLQLSFAGPSPFGTTELPPPFHQQQSQTTLTPTSYRSSNTASDRSPTTALEPNSRTMTSSPASAFSWMDPTSPRRSVGTSYGAGAHPDDFVHLHDDDIRSENAFSIGSYDDLSNMGSGSSNHGRTPLDRSDAGSDDDEPMSPPHNSEQGSARSRSRSPSDWESVGSPSSSASHHRLV